MPTLVYLSGWTSTAVQTDISMLESTPTRKEVDNYSVEDIPSNESTKRSSSDSSIESLNERAQTTKKVPNKKSYGGVQSTLFNANKRSRYDKDSNLKSTCKKKRHYDSDSDSDSN